MRNRGIRYLWTQNEGRAAEIILPSNGLGERKNPRHNAVLAGLWTWGSKWAPFSFFRLFWPGRTCTPKPGKAPIVIAVGSKNIFQSRAWQGQQVFVCYSTSFTYRPIDGSRKDHWRNRSSYAGIGIGKVFLLIYRSHMSKFNFLPGIPITAHCYPMYKSISKFDL